MRVIVGLISTNTLKDVKEVGKIFHPSRTVTEVSLQTRRKRQICLTPITRQSSTVRTIFLTHSANSGVPFITDVKIIWRRIKAIVKNKSVGPNRVSGEILKMGEAIISYIPRLLDTTVNNGSLLGDLKKATVIPVYKGVIDHRSQIVGCLA